MNMKDATILLIFFLAILGLMVGVYCSEDVSSSDSSDYKWQRIYEDNDGIFTVSLEKMKIESLDKFFT